jgi:hypothetical protein
MRLTLFPALAALALCACATTPTTSGGSPLAPSTYADKTAVDESAAEGFEVAVTVAADLATLAVQTGRVKGADLDRLARASAVARIAVAGVRSAYRSGNSATIAEATANAKMSIAALSAIAKGEAR